MKLLFSNSTKTSIFFYFPQPLRDIAVVMGQTARFECIVQAEPQPNIIWSRNGRIIENSEDYEIHYRNGVCRLVIPRAYDGTSPSLRS